MSRFWPEPAYSHASPARIGILLVNLGTPDAPTAAALRPYLKEFLWDPRVVEIPRPLWWLILNGVILNLRPAKSAAKYAAIWTREGSPLRVHTEKQVKLLRGWLGEHGARDVVVDYAMRYGTPSIRQRLDALRAQGCARILVMPLYPQYSASTTASTMDEVARCLRHWRNLPELRFVRSFHDHPGYIAALAARIEAHFRIEGRPEKLVMSFHGVPRFHLDKGDPYHCECHKTARLLAERLGLKADEWLLTFQSRFGKAEWLQPYTQASLEALARGGTKRVDVVCPGFVSDCLETLEEIAMENREAFLGAGGRAFHYISCLNEQPQWIAALGELTLRHIGDWLEIAVATPATDELRSLRARALGATT